MPLIKRLPLFLVVSLLVVVSAEAQRRRAVRSAPPQQASSNCHTFGLVRAGLIGDYEAVAPGGTVTFTITYIYDTPTQTKTTQRTVTPQATTEVTTILDGVVEGHLRGLKHFNTKGVVIIPGFGSTPLEVDVNFVPSLIAGPAAGWCVGETWTVSPVTETIVTKSAGGNFTNIVTTIASEGIVLAVGDEVTVPAGKFKTVKYRGAIVSGQDVSPAVTWVSMEENIVVKQETLDSSGNVTSTVRLMRLQ